MAIIMCSAMEGSKDDVISVLEEGSVENLGSCEGKSIKNSSPFFYYFKVSDKTAEELSYLQGAKLSEPDEEGNQTIIHRYSHYLDLSIFPPERVIELKTLIDGSDEWYFHEVPLEAFKEKL